MFYRPIDDHLALKLASPLDAEEVFALIDRDREHLRRFLPFIDAIHDVDDERQALERIAGQFLTNQVGTWIVVDGVIVGSVGCPLLDWASKKAEIGYWISSSHAGKGYVTRSVREVERMVFLDMGLQRVEIHVDAVNERSRAVPERLGYTLEGILRRSFVTNADGDIADRCVYSILRPEWEAREAEASFA